MIQIRKSLCLFLALMSLNGIVTSLAYAQNSDVTPPPASFEDDQQDHADDQLSMSEETLPVQPPPYTIDEAPSIQAEPIDDDGDF